MRILILMSHTGGGHKASAQALQAGFERHYPQSVEVEMVDLLIDHVARPSKRAIDCHLWQKSPPLSAIDRPAVAHPNANSRFCRKYARMDDGG